MVKVIWKHPSIDDRFQCVGSLSHLESLDEVGYLFLKMDENCAVVNLSHVASVEMLDQLSPKPSSKQKSSPDQSVTSVLLVQTAILLTCPFMGISASKCSQTSYVLWSIGCPSPNGIQLCSWTSCSETDFKEGERLNRWFVPCGPIGTLLASSPWGQACAEFLPILLIWS